MRDGLPCYAPRVIPQNVQCKQILQTPLLRSFSSKAIIDMGQLTFSFISNETSKICCKSSSVYMKLYGMDCSHPNPDIQATPKCMFSKVFSLYPCSDINLQENTKFCIVPEVDCIVQLSFTTFCGKKEPITCDQDLSCKNVLSLE